MTYCSSTISSTCVGGDPEISTSPEIRSLTASLPRSCSPLCSFVARLFAAGWCGKLGGVVAGRIGGRTGEQDADERRGVVGGERRAPDGELHMSQKGRRPWIEPALIGPPRLSLPPI